MSNWISSGAFGGAFNGTITNADVASNAAIGYSKVVQTQPPGVMAAAPSINIIVASSVAASTAALTPVFVPIEPQGNPSITIAQLAARVTTASASNNFGMAVYSYVVTDATHWSASLVCQLNAVSSTATTKFVKGDITTGAAGSGTGTATLDFTTTRYVIGLMASDTSAQFLGHTLSTAMVGVGMVTWTSSARSSATDWPSSFDQTTTGTVTAVRLAACHLVTTYGKTLP